MKYLYWLIALVMFGFTISYMIQGDTDGARYANLCCLLLQILAKMEAKA